MIRAAAVLWALFALPAAATQDGWPALHDVTGVAADDVLNLRAAPDASAPVIGRLAPDATGIEVIRPTGDLGWGLVNTGEGTGWVSLRFLERRPGQWDGAFPEIAACFGTEPFWSLRRDGDALVFETPDAAPRDHAITVRSGSANRRDSFHLMAEGPDEPAVAIFQTRACSDGMSDREYGIGIELLLGTGPGTRHLSGCCTLAAQ